MGLYQHLSQLYRKYPEAMESLQKERLIEWRRDPAVLRLEHPTNLVRAHALGYRAKQGYVIVRVRLKRGGKQRPSIRHGRRSKHFGHKFVMGRSFQWIAEQRANKQFPNMEVLNSYWMGKDGISAWYEVILVDPKHPSIKADERMRWIATGKHTRRVYRGLTSSAKKSRGFRYKGKGSEKARPSVNATGRK